MSKKCNGEATLTNIQRESLICSTRKTDSGNVILYRGNYSSDQVVDTGESEDEARNKKPKTRYAKKLDVIAKMAFPILYIAYVTYFFHSHLKWYDRYSSQDAFGKKLWLLIWNYDLKNLKRCH